MRPLTGATDLLTSRERCRSTADGLSPNPPTSASPVTCYITTEAELDAAEEAEIGSSQQTSPWHRQKLGIVDSSCRAATLHREPSSPNFQSGYTSPSLSSDRPDMTSSHQLQPPTPSWSAISGPPSAISSTSSRRQSLTASSVDIYGSSAASLERLPRREPTPMADTDNPAQQLIMPSLNVPRRRPFTEAGKALGKLKILVAGQNGIGKTSLIRSLAQTCEHIVHMDPVDSPHVDHFNEIHASTRPCPWWQSTELNSFVSSSRRRRSSTDEVLDRNLCFVDPLIRNRSSVVRHEATYVESQLLPLLQKPMKDSDLFAFLSGGAAPIVDIVLYMIPQTGPNSVDLDKLRALQKVTNVVPVLARAEGVASETLAIYKEEARFSLENAGVQWFSFSRAEPLPDGPCEIYAVSSASRPDYDTIDASILMSSEYIPPLAQTDLDVLASHMFTPDGSAWLRHSAAMKCVEWRRNRGWDDGMLSAVALRREATQMGTASPFTADPFGQPQYWRRVEIADWAQGLRHSLKAQHVSRVSDQELVLQTLVHGREVAVSGDRQQQAKRCRRRRSRSNNPPHQDPLGILELVSHAKYGGQTTIELLSSIGILGCIAAWLVRPDFIYRGDVSRLPGWCFAL